MTLTARVILVTLPVATVMATASTVAVLKTPWNVLHGTAGALVALGQWHLAPGEPAAGSKEPALALELQMPVVEAAAVVDPPPAPAPVEPAEVAMTPVPAATVPVDLSQKRGEDESVDYARLRKDVQVVTSTLERFNQKLLRMIAQARAGQRPPAPLDAVPMVALDAASPASATPDEASQ